MKSLIVCDECARMNTLAISRGVRVTCNLIGLETEHKLVRFFANTCAVYIENASTLLFCAHVWCVCGVHVVHMWGVWCGTPVFFLQKMVAKIFAFWTTCFATLTDDDVYHFFFLV